MGVQPSDPNGDEDMTLRFVAILILSSLFGAVGIILAVLLTASHFMG